MKVDNYLPHEAEVVEVVQETGSNLNIKTFHLRLKETNPVLDFKPGQFLMLTVYGVGEAPFGFASAPLNEDKMIITVKETGRVTSALHELLPGDTVGLRGPYGNTFPVQEAEGKDIYFISGGIGLAPLRSAIDYMLAPEQRDKFGRVQMLQAFRSPDDMIYDYEQNRWENSPDTMVKYTIDRPCEGWDHCVGFPHELIDKELDCQTQNAVYYTCGPPIMIKAVTSQLVDLGVNPKDIITTLEMRMSCGLGKCGKCNIGHRYVCKEGPVFSYQEILEMPEEY
ncbi:MAG: FAD/NAD(P)-binding protein [Bacillota bacterium]